MLVSPLVPCSYDGDLKGPQVGVGLSLIVLLLNMVSAVLFLGPSAGPVWSLAILLQKLAHVRQESIIAVLPVSCRWMLAACQLQGDIPRPWPATSLSLVSSSHDLPGRQGQTHSCSPRKKQ